MYCSFAINAECCFFFLFQTQKELSTSEQHFESSSCIFFFFLDSIYIKPAKLKKWRQIRSGNRIVRFYILFSMISKPAAGNYDLAGRSGYSCDRLSQHLLLVLFCCVWCYHPDSDLFMQVNFCKTE